MSIAPSQIKTMQLGTLAAELVVGTVIVAPAGGALGGAITYGLVALKNRARRSREP